MQKKLYSKFKHQLSLVDQHPEMGIKTDFEEIRGLIVGNFILLYEIKSSNIIVHSIWDSRQDPENLKIK
ncbi:type II toxin-antitoxin system RelE/ParE family toxin [Algoriphagus antarcticus]|uniref:type II toxin-antitoxin system RelE/ParE family toxin n=1 Tax=Algoriphagus antarcticus TaxID=238540 RepID=UPI0037424A04